MRGLRVLCAMGVALLPIVAAAQSLSQAFEAAWERSPDGRAQAPRRTGAEARQAVAASLTPEPPSVELAARSDRFNRDTGAQEVEVGLAVPLWLPGERGAAREVADAELAILDARQTLARLTLAGEVRELYWSWRAAEIEGELARARHDNATQLAADVERRVRAGDLSRADQYQAQAALAAAEAAVAEAAANSSVLRRQLRALSGVPAAADGPLAMEIEPVAAADDSVAAHPLLVEANQRIALARGHRALAGAQSRANPELTIGTRRERAAFDAPYEQSLQLALRIPFSSGSRNQAKLAEAHADQLAAESQQAVDRERIAADIAGAQDRLAAARTRLAAAEKRARLLQEIRGFLEKAFRLGEADLPSRLRVELESFEAARQEARSRIELAQAISRLRQALGLLPEMSQ